MSYVYVSKRGRYPFLLFAACCHMIANLVLSSMWPSANSDIVQFGHARQERLPKGTIGLSDNSNNSLFLPPTESTINATYILNLFLTNFYLF